MKTQEWKRFLLIFLSVLMVLSLFACGETPEETTAENLTDNTEGVPTETTEPDKETADTGEVVTTDSEVNDTTAEGTDDDSDITTESDVEIDTEPDDVTETSDAITESDPEPTDSTNDTDKSTDSSATESEPDTVESSESDTTESEPDTFESSESDTTESEPDTVESSESDTTESEPDTFESSESDTTESEPDTVETTEPEPVETEWGRDVVSFVNYNAMPGRSSIDLKEGPAAVSFTVPAESYLREFYINLSTETKYTACAIEVNMYSFNGNYADSIKTEPIYSEIITSALKTHTIRFENKKFGAGNYLLVVSYSEKAAGIQTAYSSVMIDSAWKYNTVPANYAEYSMTSYINGKQKNNSIMCCAMAIDRNLPVITPETDTTPNTGKDDENVAKVILLAGQSNAAGVSQISILQGKIGAEEFERYKNGFPNVKILYKSGNQDAIKNSSTEFVNVQLGQGIDVGSFGPEIGLAAYLSEAYPDETFYIIKYGVGGTNLFAHWNATDSSGNKHLVGFKDTIDEGIGMLESAGLNPKIVGWLWMQGESDSTEFYHAHEYYNRQKALVEDIRGDYAEYASARGIPFIDAATSDSGFFASWFLVNHMKLKYSKENLDNYYIDTISYGLTTLNENNDLAHYDSMSMLILGRLFGDKLAYALDGDKDDNICSHKESALKSDKDVHFTACELCNIRLSSEKHVPTGNLEYDAANKAYKGACFCGADAFSSFCYSTEARSEIGGCEDVNISLGTEDGDGYVRYAANANKRARIYLIFGNANVTGQYMVVKYRLVNNGNNSELKDTFTATAVSTNPMARGNGDESGSLGVLIGDGEWHYLVVDLAAKNAEYAKAGAEPQFKADANGNYAVKYIRADFLTAAYDGSCYLDIASIGFADQIDAISGFVEICPHTILGAVEYDQVSKSYKRACSLCGEAICQDFLTSFEGRTTNGGCEDVTVAAKNESGDAFARYTPNADKRARVYLIFGNKTVTGQYMILKYRLVNNNANAELSGAFAATTESANTMARGNGDECGTLGTIIGDGEWHYLVVDLSAKNAENAKEGAEPQFKADEDGDYACSYVRVDFVLQAYDGSCYLDVTTVGFADQLDAANKFVEAQTASAE